MTMQISFTCLKRNQDDLADRASFAELVQLNLAAQEFQQVANQERWKWSKVDGGLELFLRAEEQARVIHDRFIRARLMLLSCLMDEGAAEQWLRKANLAWDGKSAYEMLEEQVEALQVYDAIKSLGKAKRSGSGVSPPQIAELRDNGR